MNQKLLLTIVLAGFCVGVNAQKKQQRTTAYAITGVEKGSRRWSEVRLIDVNTGEEIETVYQSSKEFPVLNARTGKPVVKKDDAVAQQSNRAPFGRRNFTFSLDKEGVIATNSKGETIKASKFEINTNGEKTVISHGDNATVTEIQNNTSKAQPSKVEVTTLANADRKIIIHRDKLEPITIYVTDKDGGNILRERRIIHFNTNFSQNDKPFGSYSAACAYDKKHERLYYTPLGLNQLRYIDMSSKEPKIYYFEDESFGVLNGRYDVQNQVTRMAFSSEGDGYALTNSGEHLIRFTTNKKAEITDLGSLNDDASNPVSIHSRSGFGGDMVADDKNNLYLITAGRAVFKISIDKMIATYVGAINGLPEGYSTNGAAVEKETTIVISSSQSTMGYYKFDLKTLEAEKISASESVFTASDLANGNLISEKKQDEKVASTETPVARDSKVSSDLLLKYKMNVYPNPAVRGGSLNISFNDFPSGRYQVQLMDLAGKLISAENTNIGGKMQLHLLSLPTTLTQGTYLVKVVGDANKDKVLVSQQVVVQ